MPSSYAKSVRRDRLNGIRGCEIIRDENDFNQHVDYIHWNPVKPMVRIILHINSSIVPKGIKTNFAFNKSEIKT